ncbi:MULTISPECIES: hypothetical protein [Bacteroides]|uniref:Uncharacterized protein n=1 Tax=Bacteroides fragilis TaxID=817 RepID=A0AAE6BZJ3_BACFG|nr:MULTISPECIES: hypothetical protein [Bacteroides]MCE8629900.1 hypothetical protein [Bacteroides fragilis]MCE8673201.1 hypothetical protein [Bacteroides fragilis]MCM0234149.1 hypothetical protein [Bacteroides fragilis]MCM0364166.1 hypothetical protein [Bacteroides fragilis]MCY6291999.1 hypothetical protein [Bacteroides fragilis]
MLKFQCSRDASLPNVKQWLSICMAAFIHQGPGRSTAVYPDEVLPYTRTKYRRILGRSTAVYSDEVPAGKKCHTALL